jgi:hypothetical protein
VSTGDCKVTAGSGRTGSGYAYLDLVGDTTYNGYGLRVIRGNAGANATSQLIHKGTGDFELRGVEASAIKFSTSATTRMTIGSAGEVAIGTTPQTGWELYVSGDVGVTGVMNGALRLVPGTAPTSSTDSTGSQWDVRVDAGYIYVRVATSGNYWERVALAPWT